MRRTRAAISAVVCLWCLSLSQCQRQPEEEEVVRLNERVEQLSQKGQWNEALRLGEEALTQATETRSQEHLGTAQGNLRRARKELGLDGEFGPVIESVLTKLYSAKKEMDCRDVDALILNMRQRGQTELPVSSAEQALASCSQLAGKNSQPFVQALTRLGNVYETKGQLAHALPYYQRAVAIHQQHFSRVSSLGTVDLLKSIAKIHHAQGKHRQALEFYRQTLRAEEQHLEHLFALPFEAEKYTLIERVTRDTGMLLLSLVQQHFLTDPEAVGLGLEWVLRRKGVALDAESQHQAATIATRGGKEALSVWQRFRRNTSLAAARHLQGLNRSVTCSDQPLVYEQPSQVELYKAIADDKKFLTQLNQRFTVNPTHVQVTPAEVARRLPSESVLIEFVRLPEVEVRTDGQLVHHSERYLAFVLTPDNRVTMVNLGDSKKVDAAIEDLRARMDNALDDLGGPKPAAPRLYRSRTQGVNAVLIDLHKDLIAPLASQIQSSRRWIVSPDGELHRLSFAALQQPSGRYLIESHSLSYVTSGRDLLRKAGHITPGLDLLMVANPTFGQYKATSTSSGHSPTAAVHAALQNASVFPFDPEAVRRTQAEAKKIESLVLGKWKTVLDKEKATETAVRQTRAPRILHLATHGFFVGLDSPSEPKPSFANTDAAKQQNDIWMPPALDCDTPQTVKDRLQQDRQYYERNKHLRLGIGTAAHNVWQRTASQERAWLIPKMMEHAGLALAEANRALGKEPDEDGLLTGLEVTSMNLHGTALVVLSACETGEGTARAGEGLYGLRRAFVLAGANALVASLWRADDGLTGSQMESFYRHLGQGQTVTEALRKAQLQSIKKLQSHFLTQVGEALAPVWLWAPFIAQQTGTEVRLTQEGL